MGKRNSTMIARAEPDAPAILSFCHTSFECDRSGALWWPDEQTLIVADLHLEKGSSFARNGAFLPPYDTTATLTRLSNVIARFQPMTVVLLGDSFHDAGAIERLDKDHRHTVKDLQNGRDWIWVTGNHDPNICNSLDGRVVDDFHLGGITFRHEPGPLGTEAEIAGHLHPCARIVRYGRSIRRRCFVSDGKRAVLPAFGAYTGGLNLCDEAFSHVFKTSDGSNSVSVWMLGRDHVYPMPWSNLKPD